MNGILLIDKEAGMTSRDVVNKVCRLLGTKRVGHTGTLDPMATGVLVLCIGNATKVVDLISSYDKEYITEMTLGIETDTLDITGNIINQSSNVSVTKEQVEDALKSFMGKIIQEVPKYSAIKIDGKRLYNYARNNIDIELPKREIIIHSISLISDLDYVDDKIKFQIKCHVSKGTYIRSLIRDIGLNLGYPATMSALRRTSQGNFKIDECYTLENIENNHYQILDMKDVLSDIEEIIVDKEMEAKIRNGNIIDKDFKSDIVKVINPSGELIALYQTYEKDPSKAKPYKMF